MPARGGPPSPTSPAMHSQPPLSPRDASAPPASPSPGAMTRRPSLAPRRESRGAGRRESQSGDVGDLVLLPDVTEDAVVEALVRRFGCGRIYTFAGDIVVSMNPFKALDVYGPKEVALFREHAYHSNRPPHIFAAASRAYRAATRLGTPQALLFGGESGSGKSEACKAAVAFLAAVSGRDGAPTAAGRTLVDTAVALEALGNARTQRNDNSSRFVKHAELLLDVRGQAVGARIHAHMLERSRATSPASDERNFHVFYQLLAGADDALRSRLELSRDPRAFRYLRRSQIEPWPYAPDDAAGFAATVRSLEAALSPADIGIVFGTLAAVLHLGNVRFTGATQNGAPAPSSDSEAPSPMGSPTTLRRSRTLEGPSEAAVRPDGHLERACALLGCDAGALRQVMTTRAVDACAGDPVRVPMDKRQSREARDAVCRALYQRLFEWIVARINERAAVPKNAPGSLPGCVVGVVDACGFETAKVNTFETFCVNYADERLQQLFVHCTLRAEQDDYVAEGIPWALVEYFNNELVCDLLDKKPSGIIPIVDEECVLGDKTHYSLVQKLNAHCLRHPHYEQKVLARKHGSTGFIVKHFAGTVTYTTNDFLRRNRDVYNRDATEALVTAGATGSGIVATLFKDVERPPPPSPQHDAKPPRDAPSTSFARRESLQGDTVPAVAAQSQVAAARRHSSMAVAYAGVRRIVTPTPQDSRRRTETVASQFRGQLQTLLAAISACTVHHVRCIRPNASRIPSMADEALVRAQVRTLCVVESARLRRAGYSLRQPFAAFVARYRMLCPTTWPQTRTSGAADLVAAQRDAVASIMQQVGVAAGEYALGRTRVFVRESSTVLFLEALRERALPWVAAIMQRAWRGYAARSFLRRYKAARTIQAAWRRFVCRRAYVRTRAAATIQAHYRGYAVRQRLRRDRAVTTIARVWRGYSTRRRIFQSKAVRLAGTVLLQAVLRRRFQRLRLQTRAARTIQRHVRGFLVRKNLHKIRAAIIIQMHFRRYRARRHCAAVVLQSRWRARQLRRAFAAQRRAVLLFQCAWRFVRVRRAALTVQRHFRGRRARSFFLQHKRAALRIQAALRAYKARIYFEALLRAFNASGPWNRKEFPAPPSMLRRTCDALDLRAKWKVALAGRFIATIARQEKMAWMHRKVRASELFRGQKSGYAASVAEVFAGDYLKLARGAQSVARKSASEDDAASIALSVSAVFSDVVNKVNRNWRVDAAAVAVSVDAFFRLNPKTLRVKERILLSSLQEVAMSPYADCFVVFKFAERHFIFECRRYVELVTLVSEAYQKATKIPLRVTFADVHDMYFAQQSWKVHFQGDRAAKAARIQQKDRSTILVSCPTLPQPVTDK